MYSSPEDEAVVREIGRQCDDADWTPGRRDAVSACFWSASLPDSPVIGFERVCFVEGADLDEMARCHAEGIVETRVRGALHPSGWRLSPRSDGRTAVEHIVIRELDGTVSRRWQNRSRFAARAGRSLARHLVGLRRLADASEGRR